jgi:MPBQ/MSBQ methyltransferase
MRYIQGKREAYWFYRFVSPLYDRWINPLFWTPAMRSRALELARLDQDDLRTVDVGAGTGFSTEGIVERVDARHVTMLDQSPEQLGRASGKPALAACTRLLGDAERLPFESDAFDRYVSCGSIEYWPDPLAAIAEAYRVLRPGGIGLIAGPLPPSHRLARLLADIWMLFPAETQYREWFRDAGFDEIEVTYLEAPWQNGAGRPFGLAIAGRKPAAGSSPAAGRSAGAAREPSSPVRLARFVLGSLAGAAFVPIGVILNRRARRARRVA